MLEKIKSLIGLAADDTGNDDKLNLLISLAVSRLKSKIKNIDPPEELDYIIIEVVVKRFNRIGSEGLKAHSVEGESLTFSDDDFNEFEADIQAFNDSRKEKERGKVYFI